MKAIKLEKRPFVRIKPQYVPMQETDNPLVAVSPDTQSARFVIIPQDEFLRELSPSGHKILDPSYYPDKYVFADSQEIKEANNGKGMWMRMPVYRYTTPLQFVILIKQLATLCGEPISLKDTAPKPDDKQKELFQYWKQQWKDRNMDEMFYLSAKSDKITGDCALVFFFKDGKIACRPLSFANGDTLFEYLDENNGQRSGFARKYTLADENGKGITHVEYWDDKFVYSFTQVDGVATDKTRAAVAETLGLSGYTLDEGYPKKHGFQRCPVAYHRSEAGACWSPVQELIDQYEMNMSLLGENNKATAFSVMYFLGDDFEIKGGVDGRPYAITSSNPDTKVGMMSQPHESENFSLMLKTSLEQILMGSFTVVPPEVRSGDLAGVAVKLIFSPSLELGLCEAKEWNSFIDDMVDLFNYGLGIESKSPSDYNRLSVHGEIEPHIHQNTAEVINNLCASVQNGILSIQTAIERNPFSAPDEKSRVSEEEVLENINQSSLNDGMNQYNMQRKKVEEE